MLLDILLKSHDSKENSVFNKIFNKNNCLSCIFKFNIKTLFSHIGRTYVTDV